jgi:hypothetical protein
MSDDTAEPGERRDVLRQEILDSEVELRDAVTGLAQAAEHKLDVAGYIRASPATWIASAFCLGIWLGTDSVGTRSRHYRNTKDFRGHR